MADGNLTERQKIAARLREAQEKAAEAEKAYNDKLAGKLEETRKKIKAKQEAITKGKENLAKHEEKLLELQVLEEQYTSELAEVEANSTEDVEVPETPSFQ